LEDDQPGTEERPEIPQNWQLAMNHLFSSDARKTVSIKAITCHMPSSSEPLDLWLGMGVGLDTAVEIPVKRIDVNAFYDHPANPFDIQPAEMKSYTRHGAFVEGADLFDNRFFAISNMEASGMDPTQYMQMSVGYACLQKAGFTKKTLLNAQIGVYVANGLVEPPPRDISFSCGGTGASRAVSCGRISFSLGLQGPCCNIDAEAASSFAAIEVGFQSIRHQAHQFKTALAGSAMLIFSERVYLMECAAKTVSAQGRCFSFDAWADGYLRSEGCGFTVIQSQQEVVDGKPVEVEGERDGVFCALQVSSSGRTARLGAPNAAVEQGVIAEALRSAELAPLNVDFVECHGGGDLLCDSIEASYLARCLRYEDRDRPLHIGDSKTHIGFLREPAGFVQLIKLLGSMSYGVLSANQHLKQISPYIEEMALESTSIATEVVPSQLATNYSGVTSRGLGGMVTHAIVGVQVQDFLTLPHVLPAKPKKQRWHRGGDIAFWPAGGGLLDDAAEPSQGYSIVGSWSGWSEVQAMEEEAPSVYGFTVSLPADTEGAEFQIWLDGDPQRALHPTWPGAGSGAPMAGPHSMDDLGYDSCWSIGVGQEEPGAASAACRCRIRLRVAGRWRIVDWEWEDATATSMLA